MMNPFPTRSSSPPRSPHTLDSPDRANHPASRGFTFPFPAPTSDYQYVDSDVQPSAAAAAAVAHARRESAVSTGVATTARSKFASFAGAFFGRRSSLGLGLESAEGGGAPAGLGIGVPSASNPYSPALRRNMGHHQGKGMRLSRREFLLCMVTLALSWLVFHDGSRRPASSTATRIPGTPASPADVADGGVTGYEEEDDVRAGSLGWIPSLHRFGIGGVGGGWWGSGQGYDGYGGDSSNAVCTTVAGTQITDQKSYTKSVERFSVRVAESRMEEDDGDDDVVLGAESGLTRLVSHEPGWTMFERLYLYNGTLYAVTEEPELYPEMRMMTSTGLPASSEPGNEQAREPTGNELKLITSREAHELWDDRIWRMDGMTWLFNDGQFIDHYYHFAAELLLGVWRAYTSLSSDINSDGTTSLPAPSRAWFIRMTDQSWRDKPRFNPAILWSAFPNIAMLYADDWKDIARATASDTGKGLAKAYVFEQAILADRSAAFRGQATGSTARTVASACKLGDPGRWWWEPVRRQVLRFAGVSEDVLDRNLQGYGAIDPAVLDADPEFQKAISASLQPGDHKPLVTYISRQGSRRRLTKESHEELVAALKSHSVANGWEFLVVEAEKLTKEEQLQLAAKTTIMLGVHGNGLTHLIWMPPTPRSAVIEMFVDGGFARDYQWTAQHLGIRHFAVQHDKFATAPNEYKVDYPEGFQGTGITVVGEVVAKLIDDRLAGRI